MSTVTDVLVPQAPRERTICARALVYRSSKNNITVVIVTLGGGKENQALVQIHVPGWDHPYNGKIIKHYISAYSGTKNVEFVNDKFANHHVSLFNNEGFWRVQLEVCLPYIGQRTAIYDSDSSKLVNAREFLHCYQQGLKFQQDGIHQRKILRKKLPKS